jgi:hypothetical protein
MTGPFLVQFSTSNFVKILLVFIDLLQTYTQVENWHRVFRIASTLRVERAEVRVLVGIRGFVQKPTTHVWGPPSLLFSGHRVHFPEIKRSGPTYLHVVSRLK